MSELKKTLELIRDELKDIYNAEYTDEEREEREQDGEPCDIYEYLSNVLDYEYTISSTREYKSVKVYVALGGPTIWIDTGAHEIRGAWGPEREEAWLPSEIYDEIDDYFEELYSRQRVGRS